MQQQETENTYTIEDSRGNGSSLPDGQRVDTMTINMGPQHPSTHGVLRLILTIDGETVVKAIPDIGFLHTGIEKTADAMRRTIDYAAARGCSFYLTYHRFATARQLEGCYPRFRSFLDLKRRYDPGEVFVSDWYRHSKRMMQTI